MDKQSLQQNLSSLALATAASFKALLHSIALFHALFLGLIVGEVLLIALFFSLLVQSALVAISVALLVLTIFCYLVLRLWVYTKKKQDAEQLSEAFQESIRRLSGAQGPSFEASLTLSQAMLTLSETLKKETKELTFSSSWLKFLRPLTGSLYQRLIRDDRLFIQEQIFERMTQLWLAFIRQEPTHLEAHAHLASHLITYSQLFAHSKKHEARFKALVQRAAEEFKILNDYAPSDVWVHTQLAYTYHDLGMKEEEIKEYEAILALQPQDSETLFKLGVLYFQQGSTSKALSLYEELKKHCPQKSQQLINFYV